MRNDYDSTQVIRRRYRLPLVRYCSFRGFWDNLPREEAERLFFEDLEAQGSDQEDSDGEPTVTVKAVAFEQTVVGCGGNGGRSAGSGATQARDWEGGSQAPSVAGSARKRKRSPSVDEPARGHTSVSQPRGRPPAAKAAPSRRTLPSDDILVAGASVAAAELGQSVSRRQAGLLKARSELGRDIKNFIGEVNSKKSPFVQLQKRLQATDPDFLSLLEVDPSGIIADYEKDIAKPLKELEAGMPKLQLRAVADTRVPLGRYNPTHKASQAQLVNEPLGMAPRFGPWPKPRSHPQRF